MAINQFTGVDAAKSGKGGKKKTGLYKGKAGAAASNQDPLTFFNTALNKSGAMGAGGGAGTDFNTWLTGTFAPGMVSDYNAALADNEKTSAKKWLNKTYGVTGWNKAGKFDAGQFGSTATGPLAEKYDIYSANQNPLTRIATTAGQQGMLASNGNDQFKQWYLSEYAPQIEAGWRTAARDNPALNFSDYEQTLDPNDARRAYQFRAPQSRLPSAAQSTGGRWSWWS